MTTEQWIDFRDWARSEKPPWIPFTWWWKLCVTMERMFYEH